MKKLIITLTLLLLFHLDALGDDCSQINEEINNTEFFEALKTDFSHSFNRRDSQISGEGNVKKIYSFSFIDQTPRLSLQGCYALAILREHFASGRQSLVKELSMLERLKREGLPTIRVFLGETLEDSIVHLPIGDENGYFMEWISNAVQMEAKTPNRTLSVSILIKVILGQGKTIQSSELGRTRIFMEASSELEKPDFYTKIRWEIIQKLQEDLLSIYNYSNAIIDLQFLINPETGQIKIIDPMEILEPKDLAHENPDLLNSISETKHWLRDLIQFLNTTLELKNYPNALKKYWLDPKKSGGIPALTPHLRREPGKDV